MCRFLGFLSKSPMLPKTFMYDTDNSLVKQSFCAREDNDVVNADGFGIAWYNQAVDRYPGCFRSFMPAWSDSNLPYLVSKITTDCFLAHVRASTTGGVAVDSCHPFVFEEYAFMHNGGLGDFSRIKRNIINLLDDSFLSMIKSQVDSEYLFALIMQNLHLSKKKEGTVRLEEVVSKTLSTVMAWSEESEKPFKMNIIITDGETLLATRLSSKHCEPLALYYSRSHKEGAHGGDCVMISSEPVTLDADHWVRIENDTMILVNKDLDIHMLSLVFDKAELIAK